MALFDFNDPGTSGSTQPAFTLTPSITKSAVPTTDTSTAPVIAKQPFAATAPGLALNTILGLPAATKDVAVQIARAVPRGILSIAQTVAPESIRTNVGDITPAEDFGKVGSTLLGNDPIQSIQTKAQGISHFLQQLGLGQKTSDSLGTFLGVGGTLMDVYPIGSPERDGIEKAAQLSTEELAKFFAKTTDEKTIATTLKVLGHPEETIQDTARALVQASTPDEVKQVLKSGVIKGSEAVTGREAALAAENTKLMELPGTVKEAPSSLITQNITDNIRKTYEAAGRSEFNPTEFSKAEEELSHLLVEMDLSMPGERIFTGYGADRTVTGVPSTFPKWVPEPLRSRQLFDKVIPDLNNLQYPKGVRQRALYDTIFNELDHRLGVDTQGLRSKLKANVDTEKAISKLGSSRTPGGQGRTKLGEAPLDNQAVQEYKKQVEKQLGRPVALSVEEKRIISGQAPNKGNLQPNLPKEPQTTPGSPTAFRSVADVIQGASNSSLGEGEARTLEKSASEYLQRAASEADGRSLLDSSSLRRIIEDHSTPVSKKINLLDYIRTPDKVLTKMGLGPEATFLRKQYEGYLKELPKNIEKITAWSKQINAVGKDANVRIFKWLDGQAIDLRPEEKKIALEVKAYLKEWADRLKLPEDKRIANYITHLFDEELIRKEFDEDLAKIIEDKIPGEVYDPFLQKRLGALGFKEDTVAALDAYTKRATRKFYMDPALERIEEKGASFELSQWNYVKRYLDRVNMRPTELETLLDNGIKQIFGYKFGQRPFNRLSQKARQLVYRGLLGFNVSSALRNLTQGVNTYAELGEKYTALGYLGLLRNGTKELTDVGVLADDFIQDRTLSAVRTTLQKADKALFYLFETAEKINRGSAYYGAKARALAQGMSEEQAIEEAKALVRKTQFAFGKIDTPIFLQNDVAKTLFQLQNFTIKQAEFLGGKIAKKEFAGLARYIVASLVMLITIGKLFGMKWQDIIPIPLFNSGSNPGLSTPPLLQFPSHVGRQILTRKDKNGNPLTIKTSLSELGNDLIPFIPAGAQLKRSLQGVATVSKGRDATPTGRTRFKVSQDTGTYIRAGVFGKSNLPEAKAYYTKLGQKKAPATKKAVRYNF